jgi:hypothetical protein
VSTSVSIGFSIDNHTFIIHTHAIGFSIDFGIFGKVSFNPFSDVSLGY